MEHDGIEQTQAGRAGKHINDCDGDGDFDYHHIGIRGERILFFGPNTNTNIIRNQNFDRIRIRIIFVFSE